MTTPVPEKSLSYKTITLSVMLATVMQALDSTIANVALPHMQGSLAATQDQMSWVLTSYIVVAAISIPLVGWLAGAVGRKFIFLISIAGFVLASVLCGIAETLPQMVFFRVLQGICGAALVPLSQAILFDINSEENLGKAMALWGIGVTMGPILGPALGGWLTENYNWRWVFYINVPIGALAFAGLYWFLPETPKKKSYFDFFGFISLSLCVGALQMMLDRGELKDWFHSPEILIEGLLAGLGFYLFIVHSLTFKEPFLNLQLFKDRNFVAGSILIFVVGIMLFATLALIPPMLQNELNYPVVIAGLVTAPRGAGTMFAMFVVGRIGPYVDSRYVMIAGFLCTALSLEGMTTYSLLTDAWAIIYWGMVQGFGIGLSYVSLSTLAFTTLPREIRNEGTAFFNLMRNLGSSIGISIVMALLTQKTQIFHAQLGEHITHYNAAANSAYVANHVDISNPLSVVALNNMLTKQASMVAYINDFKFMMVLTLIFVPLVFLLRSPKRKPAEEPPALLD